MRASALSAVLSGIMSIGSTSVYPIDYMIEQANNSTILEIPFAQQNSNIFPNDEYFYDEVIKISYMENNVKSVLDEQYSYSSEMISKLEYWHKLLFSCISDKEVDLTEQKEFFNVLKQWEQEEEYNIFLNFIKDSSDSLSKRAIAFFLAQKQFCYISAVEENFILELLQSNNVEDQEYALNAILLWEKVTNPTTLKNIKIANSYLQDDLNELIEELL